ncbi:kinase-like protein, partial [Paxillus ammoniavirescens]
GPGDPPATINEGRDSNTSPLVSDDHDVNSGVAWNLNDIRSKFAPDLTGHIVRDGDEPLASGSFGDIYKGTLRTSGRSIHVAVKAIRTYSVDDGDSAKIQKRFRREIKKWLNLNHTNILPLFGTTMNFGRFPAMVCPWVENGALTSYLGRPDGNLTTVSDVAAGLQYLHSRSVVHGDLSGSNVLVDGNERACISDFGLSTLLTQLGGSTFATSNQSPGTLRWAAPELLEFHEAEGEENPPHIIPSPGSDVYSFGRIMLQVCPISTPFPPAQGYF